MNAGKRVAAGFMLAASLMLNAGPSYAQSKNYCYDHPHDKSHYCFCYHHPKECNRAYRSRYQMNRRPDWSDEEVTVTTITTMIGMITIIMSGIDSIPSGQSPEQIAEQPDQFAIPCRSSSRAADFRRLGLAESQPAAQGRAASMIRASLRTSNGRRSGIRD